MIPYGRQHITEADIDAVVAVLRSDFLTQGPAIERFETAMAERHGARYAVAVSSATAALHLACLAADVGPGDAVWTSPNTFVASANCARYCVAQADFVDIDPLTYNMSVHELAQKLSSAQALNCLPKVVIPVHFAGQSCAMEDIASLTRPHGITLIEDASHAVGAEYLNHPVGACAFSEMTIFSFHPVKIITTGEGGMILTNREDLYERLLRLRTHGITRSPERMHRGVNDDLVGPWYYEQLELGYNYRITDIQAALGLSQLNQLDAFIARRRQLAAQYDALLSQELPEVIRPAQDARAHSSWHLYVIQVPEAFQRRAVFEALRAAGVGVNVHYMPVHLQPDYLKLGFAAGDFPAAEAYYARAITLPLYPDLSDEDQRFVVSALKIALQASLSPSLAMG